MKWCYPSVASIRSQPFSPAFLKSKTYGSMAQSVPFDARRTRVGKSAIIAVKKRHTHNKLLLTDSHRRVLALSPTQPGARHDYGLVKDWNFPQRLPPEVVCWTDRGTMPPIWKTNSCWSPVGYGILTSNAPPKKTTRRSASVDYYHATTLRLLRANTIANKPRSRTYSDWCCNGRPTFAGEAAN